jgi:hypothetical protein
MKRQAAASGVTRSGDCPFAVEAYTLFTRPTLKTGPCDSRAIPGVVEMPILVTDEDDGTDKLSQQALSFALHTILAVGSWLLLMLAGYALNPASVSQMIVLLLSILVPMLAGNLVARFRRDEMATHVWLVGLIWLLIVSLWVLDMPTGPNACYQCSATEKLTRTFFSLPRPSGLVDDNGPFFGTWPAAAMLGYSIGARLALRRRRVTA